jgi:hypothetical protein
MKKLNDACSPSKQYITGRLGRFYGISIWCNGCAIVIPQETYMQWYKECQDPCQEDPPWFLVFFN